LGLDNDTAWIAIFLKLTNEYHWRDAIIFQIWYYYFHRITMRSL